LIEFRIVCEGEHTVSKHLESLYRNLLNGKLPRNLSWDEAVELVEHLGEVQPHGNDEFVFVVNGQSVFFKKPHTHGNLMNKDFGAGLLEKIERQLVRGVRLGCQLLNVAEVGLDLGIHAVAVRSNGGFRRRALGGKLLLASVKRFSDRSFVPCGGGIGSEGLPRLFAVTLGALVVGCFGMVFLGAPYKAPEETESGLAIKDGWVI
jgi:hypothetical protein